ncbi:MAG: hypothetical protein JNK21_04290, partial [Rhodospirillaceae bacterium]|nr:hypothetical protein [Rhodospirillaceae bacterium]
KSIFLWGEQGLGDEILASGMVPEVAALAGKCVLGCSARLLKLFQRSFPNVEVVDLAVFLARRGDARFDFQSSLLDLGRMRRRSIAAFPNRRSYLRADDAVTREIRAQFKNQSSSTKRIVGFSWRSFASHIGAQKTPPLDVWRPLFETPDIAFVSLQYGAAEDLEGDLAQFRAWARGPMITVADMGQDLDRQAAQMAALDQVVTVSNTTAHLAGALGVPGRVIVPPGRASLWYWFKTGDYSPWYASLRLHRWAPGQALAGADSPDTIIV